MKIYKNPDGPDLDILYPTLFFASFAFIVFFLLRTCITMDQFWGIALAALVGSYVAFYFLQKKKKTIQSAYAYLFLASTGTPLLIAFALALNYFISFQIFHAKTELKGHLEIYDHELYIRHENAPKLCNKMYVLKGSQALYGFNYIETKINKGIFGFPVLKYHQLTVD